ncbi:MAG: anti-anti-sigma factor [Pseudonocardiales bacterium]|nr:anti-anti-sigma factor [Pseudonocardiales bacterium]
MGVGMTMAGFSVDVSVHARRCDMVVTGELDLYSADELAALGLLHLAESEVDAVTLDLAGVTFIDSTGLGALVRIRNVALEFEKELALRNPSDRVQKLLKITGMSGVFDLQ